MSAPNLIDYAGLSRYDSNIKSYINAGDSAKTVTVEKLQTAETGYIASYAVKQNGAQVGATINIPKDYLVKSATVETCEEADVPVAGYEVGDKYIDFVINTVEGSGNESHVYLLVKDLVDVYTGDVNTDEETEVDIDASNVVTVDILHIDADKIYYSKTTEGQTTTYVSIKSKVNAVEGRLDTFETVAAPAYAAGLSVPVGGAVIYEDELYIATAAITTTDWTTDSANFTKTNLVSLITAAGTSDSAFSTTSTNSVQNRVVTNAMNSVTASLAPAFDATTTYAVGDFVTYEYQVYKCITAGTGAWNASNWVAADLAYTIATNAQIDALFPTT